MCVVGNSCLSALYTLSETLDFQWPEVVQTTMLIADKLTAVREYMKAEAITTANGYASLNDKAGTVQMTKVMVSLFPGQCIEQDVCLLASYMFGRVVNVIQSSATEGALHVTRYGGMPSTSYHACTRCHICVSLCISMFMG